MSDKFVTIMKSLYSTQYYTFYVNVILKKPLLNWLLVKINYTTLWLMIAMFFETLVDN